MKPTYLIHTAAGWRLYQQVRDCPIYDYHCHLSPKEIWEDVPFSNIGELWLAADHYKWRLMRAFGVDESYVTGGASWREKFQKYAETICLAAGNPLYYWTAMELDQYFGVTTPLSGETAEDIWQQCNRVIQDQRLSPRKLIVLSNVRYIATTDDPADSLEYHKQLRDSGYDVQVVPSFRTDTLLQIRHAQYRDYIRRLEAASDVSITDLTSFKEAIAVRLAVFAALGCRFSDVGIPTFPSWIADDAEAARTFADALAGRTISEEAYQGFLGNLYGFLGGLYRQHGLVMQWHLAVWRNASSTLFEQAGADAGGDCMGEDIPQAQLIAMLDALERARCLPKTILYTLKPSLTAALCNVAGSFRGCVCGAAWWFCDHKRGIAEQLLTMAEQGHLATFPGMLTDSRSFLSYARHDYFRRIACDMVGQFVEDGEFDEQAACTVVRRICCDNMQAMVQNG